MSGFLIGYTRTESTPEGGTTGLGPCHAYSDGHDDTLCSTPLALTTRRTWPDQQLPGEGLCRACQREAARRDPRG